MVGLASVYSAYNMRAVRCAALKFCAAENVALFFMWTISAPAQKLGPAPTSTSSCCEKSTTGKRSPAPQPSSSAGRRRTASTV